LKGGQSKVDWQRVKETIWLWYGRIAAFWLLQSLLMYLAACMVAHKAVGITAYVSFLYHCCQWR
jgi:hypothetical protein